MLILIACRQSCYRHSYSKNGMTESVLSSPNDKMKLVVWADCAAGFPNITCSSSHCVFTKHQRNELQMVLGAPHDPVQACSLEQILVPLRRGLILQADACL